MLNKKIKPILPSLREKKRYLVFEVISKEPINDFKLVWNSIRDSCIHFLGQLGVAKAGIIPLENKWNSRLQKGIIRISHKHVDSVRASFALAGNLAGKEAIIKSLGVSGILKKAEENYLK